MADVTFWFGQSGQASAWYLADNSVGFSAIDISLLPGPKPAFTPTVDLVTDAVTGTAFSNQTVYFNRVLLDTVAGQTTVDTLRTWNLVKNLQIKSDGAQKLYVDGVVHVDAQIGVGTTDNSYLFLNGVKRANVITGGGADIVEIRMVTYDYSAFSDDFRINTGAGDDYVRLGGLDVAGELAAGDTTYSAWLATGQPLIANGIGRNSYVNLGTGNDRFIGYASNDFVIGGADTGTIETVKGTAPATGFGYSIGGNLLCGSSLYKINLETGQTTEVGQVKVPGFFGFGTAVDVESLSFNPKDGMLYGFATSLGGSCGLIKVDPNTAKTTFIGGAVSKYASLQQDMAFASDGTLYLASEGDLVKVNTGNGSFKIVGDNTLSTKISALAIDPTTNKLFGLSYDGLCTTVTTIDKNTGQALASFKVGGLPFLTQIEGMSFDSAGTLWAEDRLTGKIYTIDLVTKMATYESKTLGVSWQNGDGFEAMAIDNGIKTKVVDLNSVGGDIITTGAGQDHIFYTPGSGVDKVTDFDVSLDVLHIAGYSAADIRIDKYNGDTFIRFADNSADGYVDNAMIELSGVTTFTSAMISFTGFADVVI